MRSIQNQFRRLTESGEVARDRNKIIKPEVDEVRTPDDFLDAAIGRPDQLTVDREELRAASVSEENDRGACEKIQIEDRLGLDKSLRVGTGIRNVLWHLYYKNNAGIDFS